MEETIVAKIIFTSFEADPNRNWISPYMNRDATKWIDQFRAELLDQFRSYINLSLKSDYVAGVDSNQNLILSTSSKSRIRLVISSSLTQYKDPLPSTSKQLDDTIVREYSIDNETVPTRDELLHRLRTLFEEKGVITK